MEISPHSTECINYYPEITKELTGPKHFVITREFTVVYFASILNESSVQ